ncbi:hypothetical protein [Paracidovorax avenae]|uniref:hypothetical protein n=1 Tax=Paracidovorax avenae TaxID=80867 RepID=UPI001AD8047A|nr:hypothetical protein [Paracidovorax avenae]
MYIEIFFLAIFVALLFYLGGIVGKNFHADFGEAGIKITRKFVVQNIEIKKIKKIKKKNRAVIFYGDFDVYVRGVKRNIGVIEIMENNEFDFEKLKKYLVSKDFRGDLVT